MTSPGWRSSRVASSTTASRPVREVMIGVRTGMRCAPTRSSDTGAMLGLAERASSSPKCSARSARSAPLRG